MHGLLSQKLSGRQKTLHNSNFHHPCFAHHTYVSVLIMLNTYTASKNYMQIGVFVILYRFLNQCFGNLARGIVTFVSAYMK